MPSRNKRGRPPKFGRPSRVVALTLPEETIRGLRKFHPDLAWAVVTLFEKRDGEGAAAKPLKAGHAELVSIGDDQFLVVINSLLVRRLPGVDIIPLNGNRAFLALEPGRGMPDLELTVRDRLEQSSVRGPERIALEELCTLLSKWRRDPNLRMHSRAIIVVERVRRRKK